MTRRLIALLTAMLLLAGACSTSTTTTASGEAEAEAASSPEASEPTAEPEATEPTAQAEPTVETEPTVEAEPTVEPEPTEAPEPTVQTESTTATESTATESTTDEPTREPADASDLTAATEQLVDEFADDVSDEEVACVFAALGENADLAVAALADSLDDLPLEQQADLTVLMFDCAPEATARSFTEAISDESDGALPPEVSECLVDAMTTSDDRRQVIIGFVVLGEEEPVPAASQEPLIDTLVECMPIATLIASAGADDLGDEAFEQAMDMDCLADTLDDDATRSMWTAMVTNAGEDFDDLDAVEPLMAAMFSCMSFGRIIAAEFASDGSEMSESTITCIDDELADLDFVTAMDDPSSQQVIGLAIVGCLTPEELAQMN